MTISAGVITSPSYPGNYPNDIDKIEHITVETGKILRIEFAAFAVHVFGNINTCPGDFVRITDGDGTTLMDNSCGYYSWDPSSSVFFQPPIITTKTNKVEIYFHTNGYWAASGWSLRWTAVAEGEFYQPVCVISTSDCPPACFLARKKTFHLLSHTHEICHDRRSRKFFPGVVILECVWSVYFSLIRG